MTSPWYSWIWSESSSLSSNQLGDHNDEDQPASALSQTGQLLEGIEMGKRGQMRYRLIEAKRLNTETVAGIKDMNLGRVSHGVKRGEVKSSSCIWKLIYRLLLTSSPPQNRKPGNSLRHWTPNRPRAAYKL